MQMRDYKFQYKLNDKDVVRIEAISDSVPSATPLIADIQGLPDLWTDETIQWAAGSIIYVVPTGAVYMANESGTFEKITT